jgi:hypothetical protein
MFSGVQLQVQRNSDNMLGTANQLSGSFAIVMNDGSVDAHSPSDFNALYTVLASVPIAAWGVGTYQQPARALNTVFQPSLTAVTLAHYSVRIVSSLTLTGGAVGRCELLVGPTNPPTISMGRVAGGSSGTLSIGLNLIDTSEAVLSALVPIGYYVELVTTNETGTPTYTITKVMERNM